SPSAAPGASTPGSPSTTPVPSAARAASPSASPSPALAVAVVGGGSRDDGLPIDQTSLPGSGSNGTSLALLLVSGIVSLSGLALFVTFLATRRRRRFSAAVASAPPIAAPAGAPSAGASFADTRGAVLAPLPPDTPLDELGIPRWRRPSVRAARQVSERGIPIEHVPVRFREDVGAGVDRRRVTYRLVRVGTEPDEFAGEEVGRVDRGDEVEVLRESGGYCLIRTPDGIVGWIHRTTLSRPDAPPSFEIRLSTDG
ncbi:MAG TPA: SH3 domain-containing protein, partial [Candidatus Dormibacteraeota bacterium]|nr:SH3 domain-containing protein [Candidatus Dormibacteraeota bacterium]